MATNSTLNALNKLIEIMATLRAQDGCQWDREQTPQSLKPYILEETYELLEAIDRNDPVEICDELGDLLLQVVFQAQIFSENENFTIEDVAESICNKLVRRHPHIFASASQEGHQKRWEEVKLKERSARGQSNKLADRIPNTLPALKLTSKVVKKLDLTCSYIDIQQVIDKLTDLPKIHHDEANNSNETQKAFGKILFSITSLANTMRVDAEDCLRLETNKMIEQFDNTKELH